MPESFAAIYFAVARWLLPLTGVTLFWLLTYAFFRGKQKSDPKAYLKTQDGEYLPLYYPENLLGSGKSCDIDLPCRTARKRHALLTLREDGGFCLTDTQSGETQTYTLGESFETGGVRFTFARQIPEIFSSSAAAPRRKKKKPKKVKAQPFGAALGMLLIFQILAGAEVTLNMGEKYRLSAVICFAVLPATAAAVALLTRKITGSPPHIELAVFFLLTVGFAVTASASPVSLYKQLAAAVLGMAMYLAALPALRFGLKNPDSLGKNSNANPSLWMWLRYMAAGLTVLLLVLTKICGTVSNGARLWINLGFVTVQPSEFAKIFFVFALALPARWLSKKRGLLFSGGLTAVCMTLLASVSDFGGVLVLFLTFLVTVYLSFGAFPAAVLGAGSVLGGAGVVLTQTYVRNRFQAWGHVFLEKFVDGQGYQQSRTLIVIAGGGLLGLGAGKGMLRGIFAADTDLVFGLICEEWGFIIGLCAVFGILLLLYPAVFGGSFSSKVQFTAAAAATGCMFLFQTALNVFGSTDILPLTGVTVPFISNGGSSMVTCWIMLAFIKNAAYNRIEN
ncbi:MAG: FtsW/RodA/SpoVE family cell cycle protein [Oscillospiraceae bacterium]|nr:FtsW/RodA/SpoVE family cell cycle protein [Oscillospiraceae bacterium]